MSIQVEKLSAFCALLITIPGFFGAISFIIYLSLSSRLMQVYASREVPSEIPTHLVADLLVSPSGNLVAVVASSGVVDVYTWAPNIWDGEDVAGVKTPVNFSALGCQYPPGDPGPGLAKEEFSAEKISPDVMENLPYAISDDGSMIAWSCAGQLFAGPLREPRKYWAQLDPGNPVASVSFLSLDVVMVVHYGGEVQLMRLSRPDPSLPGTRLSGSWKILGRGPFRVLSRFETNDGILVDLGQKKFTGFPVWASGTVIALSPKGKIALGTSGGEIIFPRSFGKFPGVTLPEARRVQALTFYDDQRVIASVERGSLFLIDHESRVSRLGASPRGVRLLAVKSSRIAMVTPQSIKIARLRWRVVLGEHQKWLLALAFSMLSALAFLRLIVTDLIKYRFLRQDEKDGMPTPAEPEADGEGTGRDA